MPCSCLRKVKGYWGGEGLEAVIGVPQALARKNIPLTLLLRRPLLPSSSSNHFPDNEVELQHILEHKTYINS